MRTLWLALFSVGCLNASAVDAHCVPFSDPAEWPVQTAWMGDEAVTPREGAVQIAGVATTTRGQLRAELLKAELNLHRGGPDHALDAVYDAHAWLIDGGEQDDAVALVGELSRYNASFCL